MLRHPHSSSCAALLFPKYYCLLFVFNLDPLPRESSEGVRSLESQKGSARTPQRSPIPSPPPPGSRGSPSITDTGICLRTIWPASPCKRHPHRGSPRPGCYLKTPCWFVVIFKDSSFSRGRELISFQQGHSTHPEVRAAGQRWRSWGRGELVLAQFLGSKSFVT